jgi:hypothetical protein
MTTHDTPEAALAAALRGAPMPREVVWDGSPEGRQRWAEGFAAAILAALDGWTLVRTPDWTLIPKIALSQEAEIARLRAALEMLRVQEDFEDEEPDMPDGQLIEWEVTLGTLRALRAALAPSNPV